MLTEVDVDWTMKVQFSEDIPPHPKMKMQHTPKPEAQSPELEPPAGYTYILVAVSCDLFF